MSAQPSSVRAEILKAVRISRTIPDPICLALVGTEGISGDGEIHFRFTRGMGDAMFRIHRPTGIFGLSEIVMRNIMEDTGLITPI